MLLSNLLYKLYSVKNRKVRNRVRRLVCRFEKGEYYSLTLRQIFRDYHKIDIGLYSFGGCFQPDQLHQFTTFGRYCSIAKNIQIFNRNHPMDYKSMHGFFFNPNFKYCKKDSVEFIPITIGHDVWIGHNAIIMPHVKNISTGAVIGAGAVVNKDVPPYAVVVGNPSRIVRYRFSKETIEKLLASRWWEKSIEELKPNLDDFLHPYENIPDNHATIQATQKVNGYK